DLAVHFFHADRSRPPSSPASCCSRIPPRAMTPQPRSWISSLGLAVRSLAWAVLLPGLVAGYIPLRYFGLRPVTLDLHQPLRTVGRPGIAGGTTFLGLCILEFARSGRGTLSPADPPRTLVVQGLYRYVRNPMYLSVSLIVLGEALLARSRDLLGYW